MVMLSSETFKGARNLAIKYWQWGVYGGALLMIFSYHLIYEMYYRAILSLILLMYVGVTSDKFVKKVELLFNDGFDAGVDFCQEVEHAKKGGE